MPRTEDELLREMETLRGRSLRAVSCHSRDIRPRRAILERLDSDAFRAEVVIRHPDRGQFLVVGCKFLFLSGLRVLLGGFLVRNGCETEGKQSRALGGRRRRLPCLSAPDVNNGPITRSVLCRRKASVDFAPYRAAWRQAAGAKR